MRCCPWPEEPCAIGVRAACHAFSSASRHTEDPDPRAVHRLVRRFAPMASTGLPLQGVLSPLPRARIGERPLKFCPLLQAVDHPGPSPQWQAGKLLHIRTEPDGHIGKRLRRPALATPICRPGPVAVDPAGSAPPASDWRIPRGPVCISMARRRRLRQAPIQPAGFWMRIPRAIAPPVHRRRTGDAEALRNPICRRPLVRAHGIR